MIPHGHLFCNRENRYLSAFYLLHKYGGVVLDIMLEKILSLIPRKENGDFVHGEKKRFAVGLGFKSGEIVSDWIAGRSDSYKNYLYEISKKHGVSVEWLRGETDEKSPTPEGAGLTDAQKSAMELIRKMDDATLERFVAAAKAMLSLD
jgi:hypothetical protein